MAYLGKTPSQAVRSRYYFTASGSETSLSGADDNSNTLTFTDGNYVDVSLNGVALVAGTDYNTTTANTIGGLSALAANDVVEIIVYDTFSVFGGNVNADLNFKDNAQAVFGDSGDLKIKHTGSRSVISDSGTGGLRISASADLEIMNSSATETKAKFTTDGAVELYYDNNLRLITTTDGVRVTGGPGDANLVIEADTDNATEEDNATLTLKQDGGLITGVFGLTAGNHTYIQVQDGYNFRVTDSAGEYYLQALADGAVELYYDNVKKLETTSTGIDVTGTAVTDGLTVAGNVSVDSGTIKLDGNYPTGTNNVALGNTALDSGSLSGDNNTAIGSGALTANTSGPRNVAVGTDAGESNTTGDAGTAIGFEALHTNTTGNYNTAVGKGALYANTTASNNTALGFNALSANTTGADNVAIGYGALDANTTGIESVAIGIDAGGANTTGRITAVGRHAVKSNTTATENTGIGYRALRDTTTGANNTAVGGDALLLNTTGAYNVAVGSNSLDAATTGTENVAVGHASLGAVTDSTANTAVGHNSGASITTGDSNTFFGHQSGDATTTASNNTAVGKDALGANTTANNNTAVGHEALTANTTGFSNVTVGGRSLDANTTGAQNAALGYQALSANTTANNNTAMGYQALTANTTGAFNVAVGGAALDANTTASNNVAVGYGALGANTTGAQNVAVGTSAGDAITTASNCTLIGHNAGGAVIGGTNTTAVGYNAGDAITNQVNNVMLGVNAGTAATSDANTLIGTSAGELITTGAKNTILGRYNGNQDGFDIRTLSNNIVLSDGDGNARAFYEQNNNQWYLRGGRDGFAATVIDHSTTGAAPNGLIVNYSNNNPDNQSGQFIRCQDTQSTRFRVYNDGDVQNHDNSYGGLSDQKLKEQIADASSQWDDIKALTVRKFKFKTDVAAADTDNDSLYRLGVIAQEVETAGMSGLVSDSPDVDAEGNDLGTVTKGVKYSILYMKAVKALQEAMDRIETLEAKVATLEGAN